MSPGDTLYQSYKNYPAAAVCTRAGTLTGLPVCFEPGECLYNALKIFIEGVTSTPSPPNLFVLFCISATQIGKKQYWPKTK